MCNANCSFESTSQPCPSRCWSLERKPSTTKQRSLRAPGTYKERCVCPFLLYSAPLSSALCICACIELHKQHAQTQLYVCRTAACSGSCGMHKHVTHKRTKQQVVRRSLTCGATRDAAAQAPGEAPDGPAVPAPHTCQEPAHKASLRCAHFSFSLLHS